MCGRWATLRTSRCCGRWLRAGAAEGDLQSVRVPRRERNYGGFGTHLSGASDPLPVGCWRDQEIICSFVMKGGALMNAARDHWTLQTAVVSLSSGPLRPAHNGF